ncbi:hypothetical protein Forpi1262_v001994 [Fusarium oxysporum f. sp. raphani]|uniref:Trichothecene 3-O-acetyltransferase-like N-terminal domain-containing protein n=1 Tax=Fusarium oxysporum f. sp. raphani TaxID=96318 RepID=A0A8J5QBI8_FUSOX|nr:hypothetical protein Forpi1262_v001994 [Fusarium oxysporum f. sp. raphani]
MQHPISYYWPELLTVCIYNTYALFFKLDDAGKGRAVELLRAGLKRTLSQARHYCSAIKKDPGGGHSFAKKRDSTVRSFVSGWMLLRMKPNISSFEDLEKTHFSAVTLSDLETWSVPPMTYGEKTEGNPDNSPGVSAFKANFIRGGLVFNIYHHH